MPERSGELIVFLIDLTVPHLSPPLTRDQTSLCCHITPPHPASPPSTPLSPPDHTNPLHSLPDLSTHPTPNLPQQESLHGPTNTPSLSITADQVRKELRRTMARKATGPDGINSQLLKDFAYQLCGVLLHIFDLSLSLERVPLLRKTSCVVPVPNTAYPREPNHFRLVALTSYLI